MDAWSKVGPASNLNLKRGKEKKNQIFCPIFGSRHELQRERRETPHSLYDLKKSGGQNPSSQDLKFIYTTRVTRGYRQHTISWVPTTLSKIYGARVVVSRRAKT